MTHDLKPRALHGLSWTVWESVTKYGASFAVLLLLARLLDPQDFGIAALLLPIKAIAGELIAIGLPVAIVRKKDLSQAAASTVYWFQIALAVAIAGAVALSGSSVAAFYGRPELQAMLLVTAFSIVIASLSSVFRAQIQRQLRLKTLAQINVAASVLAGALAVLMALNGFGAWSLVFQGLFTQTFLTIGIWIKAGWRPSLVFRLSALIELLRFGVQLFFVGLVSLADQRIYALLIGRYFGLAELGFFNRASALVATPLNAMSQVTSRVTLPVFSIVQDDPARVVRGLRQVIRMTLAAAAPAMLGLAVLAALVLEVLFGARWIPSAPLVPAFCMLALFSAPCASLEQALVARGSPHRLLQLAVARSVLYLAAMALSFQFGLVALAWSLAGVSLAYLLLLLAVVGRALSYRWGEFAEDIWPSIASSLVMATSVSVLSGAVVFLPALPRLALCVGAGGVMYFLLWALLDRASLTAAFQLVWRRQETLG